MTVNELTALKKYEVREYHPDGSICTIETRAKVDGLFEHLYPNRINHFDGYSFIRIGKCTKYFSNGQIGWIKHFDESGNLIKVTDQYRQDGTPIIL